MAKWKWVFILTISFGLLSGALPDRWKAPIGLLAIIGLIVGAVGFLRAAIIFGPTLSIGTFFSSHDRQPGDETAEIKWLPEYSKLEVYVSNNSDQSYEDLAIDLKPDAFVAGIGCSYRSGNHPISFELLSSASVDTHDKRMRLLATNVGYKVHYARLPAGGKLVIVLALVNIKSVKDIKAVDQQDLVADIEVAKDDKNNEPYHLLYGYRPDKLFGVRPTENPCLFLESVFTTEGTLHKIERIELYAKSQR